MTVKLFKQSVAVGSVNLARLLNAFAARSGAAEAVHTYFKEIFSRAAVNIKYLAYKHILCDFHFLFFLSLFIVL